MLKVEFLFSWSVEDLREVSFTVLSVLVVNEDVVKVDNPKLAKERLKKHILLAL